MTHQIKAYWEILSFFPLQKSIIFLNENLCFGLISDTSVSYKFHHDSIFHNSAFLLKI